VAVGELGVGYLRASVGGLHRTEELCLQPVGVVGVQLVVGLGQAGERNPSSSVASASVSSSCCLASDAEYAIRGQPVARTPSKTTSSESRTLSAPMSPR
jgi:hypothetical protein